MTDRRRKLPDDSKLRRHVEDGMGLQQIAARYGCRKDHVRSVLTSLGIKAPDSAEPAPHPDSPQKVVVTTLFQRISLPRVSMHVAVIEGRP